MRRLGNFLKTQWAANDAETIVRTNGANKPAAAKAATGTRKTITYADFLEAYQKFLAWDLMPDTLLIPVSMYVDMLKIEQFIQNEFNAGQTIPKGSCGQNFRHGCVHHLFGDAL